MASEVWSGQKTCIFSPEPRRRISPENGEMLGIKVSAEDRFPLVMAPSMCELTRPAK